MAKSIHVLFLLLSLSTGSVFSTYAQAEKSKRQGNSIRKISIKINPLSAVFSTLNIKVEHFLNERISFQLGGFYSFFELTDRGKVYEYNIKSITPQARYYLIPGKSVINPGGLFVAPFFRYSYFDLRETSHTLWPVDRFRKFHQIGGGTIGGYKIALGSRVSIEGHVGFHVNARVPIDRDGSLSVGELWGALDENRNLIAGGALGFAF